MLSHDFEPGVFPRTAVDGSPLTWEVFRKPCKKSVRETIKPQQVAVRISEASKKKQRFDS